VIFQKYYSHEPLDAYWVRFVGSDTERLMAFLSHEGLMSCVVKEGLICAASYHCNLLPVLLGFTATYCVYAGARFNQP
jgi:hypothetical protein